jgi:hypothetical protein
MGTLGRAIFTVGKWIRGTGQAMDRLGSTFQGGLRVEEQGNYPSLLSPLPQPGHRLPPRRCVVVSISCGRGLSSFVNGGQFVALVVSCIRKCSVPDQFD